MMRNKTKEQMRASV